MLASDIEPLIAKVREKETLNRRASYILLFSALAAGAGVVAVLRFCSYPARYQIVAATLVAIGATALASLKRRPVAVSSSEASVLLDRALYVKERFGALVTLSDTESGTDAIRKTLITHQISSELAEAPCPSKIAPFIFSRTDVATVVAAVFFLLSAVGLYVARPLSPLEQIAAAIDSIVENNPQLPQEIKREASTLAEQLHKAENYDTQELQDALNRTRRELEKAIAASMFTDASSGSTELHDHTPSKQSSQQEQKLLQKQSQNKGLEGSQKTSAPRSPEQQNKNDDSSKQPIQEKPDHRETSETPKESPQQRHQQPREQQPLAEEHSKKNQGEKDDRQNKQQKQQQQQNPGENESQGGSEAQQEQPEPEQQQQQKNQEEKQQSSSSQSDQGQGQEQNQGEQQQSQQEQEGGQGDGQGQGNGNGQGEGEREGAATGGEKAGSMPQSQSSQGNSPTGQQGSQSGATTTGEGGQPAPAQQQRDSSTERSGDQSQASESAQDDSQNGSPSKSDPQSKSSTGSGENSPLDALTEELNKAEEALKPDMQQQESPRSDKAGGAKQEGKEQEAKGSGQKSSAQKSDSNQENQANPGNKKPSNKSPQEDPQEKQAGQQSNDNAHQQTKSNSKQGRGAQEGEPSSSEQKDGDQKEQPDRKQPAPRPDEGAQKRRPPRSGSDSAGEESAMPDRQAASRSVPGGPEDDSDKAGEGLGDTQRFKESEIRDPNETYDTRFTGQGSTLERNTDEAQPKTSISDLTLAKPKSSRAKSEQPIPLEYEEILE
jgi:hypothetical protein